MVRHDTVIIGINADVGVLGVNTRRSSRDPKRLDLLILEDIVKMHVLAEKILHSAAVVGLVIVRVWVMMHDERCVMNTHTLGKTLSCGDTSFQVCDSGLRRHLRRVLQPLRMKFLCPSYIMVLRNEIPGQHRSLNDL